MNDDKDPNMQRLAWLWIGIIYATATGAAVLCKLTGVM